MSLKIKILLPIIFAGAFTGARAASPLPVSGEAVPWFEGAVKIREMAKPSPSDSVNLFHDEQLAAQELSKLFSGHGVFAARFKKLSNADDQFNTDGDALAKFVKSLPQDEMKQFKALVYVQKYPSALSFTGFNSRNHQADFDVKETFDTLKASQAIEAKNIVFPIETADISTLCTSHYSANWQEWTEDQCDSFVKDLVKIYARYPEAEFARRRQQNAESALQQISAIRATGKFSASKEKALSDARKKLGPLLK